MQQKQRKKGHLKPIVPAHATLTKPGGVQANNNAAKPTGPSHAQQHHHQNHHHQRQRQQQQQQQQQPPKPKPHAAAATGLGKRKVAGSPHQQPPPKQQRKEPNSHAFKVKCQQQQQHTYQQQNSAQMQQQTGQHKPTQLQPEQLAKRQQQQQQQLAHSQKQGAQSAGVTEAAQNKNPHKKRKVQQPTHGKATDSRTTAATAAADLQARATVDSAQQFDVATTAVVAAAAVKPWLSKQPTAVSSNWQQLKQLLEQQQTATPKRPRKGQGKAAGAAAAAAAAAAAKKQIGSTGHSKAATPIVAMDCEMVGMGPGGERDSLARVSIVNAHGNVLLDLFVAQTEPVTDYRTWVSGITPEKLRGARSLAEVQQQVAELLQGRTIVGHGLKKDLAVLLLSHPRKHIRDTARYPPFMFSKGGKRRPRALRHLAQQELGLAIQDGQHSSVDDARAALYLYQKHAATWERALKAPDGLKHLPTANRPATKKKRIESYAVRDVKSDPMADL